jgi:hypothetical protein
MPGQVICAARSWIRWAGAQGNGAHCWAAPKPQQPLEPAILSGKPSPKTRKVSLPMPGAASAIRSRAPAPPPSGCNLRPGDGADGGSALM